MGSSDCFHNFSFSFGIFDASDIYLKFKKVIISLFLAGIAAAPRHSRAAASRDLPAWWGAQVLERSGSVVASWLIVPRQVESSRTREGTSVLAGRIPSPWTTGEVPDVYFDGGLLYQPPFPQPCLLLSKRCQILLNILSFLPLT